MSDVSMPQESIEIAGLEDLQIDLGYSKVELNDQYMLAKNAVNVC